MQNSGEILVADIGGTSSRFAKCRASADGRFSITSELWLKTADFATFDELLDAVEASGKGLTRRDVDAAVLAVPGPVLEETSATLTNVAWDVDVGHLRGGWSHLFLLNDFEAQAFGCLAEADDKVVKVKHPDQAVSQGFVVVGPGTGLGHCAMKMHRGLPVSLPSEAGQIPFPFHGGEESGYLDFLLERRAGLLPTGDHVVSGGGLSLLHEYLTGEQLSPDRVAATLDADSRTTRWFSRFLGRICRNYALACLGFCDLLFLSGGVLIKNPFLANNRHFADEFVNSDTKNSELERIGIRLVTDEALGLLGCAQYALTRLQA